MKTVEKEEDEIPLPQMLQLQSDHDPHMPETLETLSTPAIPNFCGSHKDFCIK